jgi:hypothetical protein
MEVGTLCLKQESSHQGQPQMDSQSPNRHRHLLTKAYVRM